MLAQSSDPDPEGDERNPRCFWIGPEYICPPNPTRPPTDPPPPPTPCNADPVTFECLPPPTTPPTATKPPPPTPTDPPTPTPVIIVIPPLDAPALSGRVSGTSLTLTWTEVTQADQYEVQERRIQCRSERGQQRCGEIWWLTVRSTDGLTETFSGLTVGRAYAYRVCSYRGIDRLTVCSGGQTWTIDPTARPTATPVPLTAPVLSSEAEPGVIRLTWTRVGNAEGYDVQLYTYSCQGRSASEQSERCTLWWWKTIANDLTGLNAEVRNLAEGRSHRFRVCAFIGARTACSNERSEIFEPVTPPPPGPTATPTPTATPLKVVSGLERRQHSSSNHSTPEHIRWSILLEWDAQAPGTTYEIQQKIDGDWETLPHRGFTLQNEARTGDYNGTDSSVLVWGLKFSETYEHRVRSTLNGVATEWVHVTTQMPLPYLGRQADHTVQYKIGTPVPTPTAGGVAIPDPPTAVAKSLAYAAGAWNTALSSSSSGVSLCEVGTCAGHDDQKVVTVNAGTCGRARACIFFNYADAQGFMGDMRIVIEQPGIYTDIRTYETSIYIWTNLEVLNGREIKNLRIPGHPNIVPKYAYLPHSLMHELGHAIGLEDLYRFSIKRSGSLMDRSDFDDPLTSVPPKDVPWVDSIYAGYTPHSLTP